MPEIKILGDSPTTEDGLGFDPYVNILLEAINNFDAESPLTIGIHGRWGSGKTSLMKMLEEKFKVDNKVKTIWFNAWAHGREESIGLALLQQVLIEFQNGKTKEKFAEFARSFSKLLADAALRKTTGIRLREAKELFENSIEVKNTLRGNFEDVIEESGVTRLVLFIDDLDRCLPEKTIEILEVIKLFLDVPRCVFIIGVAKEVIEQGIEVRYKTGERGIPISGQDYIDKIIQVPFTLPPISEENMIRFIGILGISISEKEKRYAKIVAKGAGYNPRKVKLFLNTLRIRQEIADKSGGKIKPELSTKLLAIEHSYPRFYKDVVTYREQDFLCKVERLAKGEDDEELRKELEGSETMQKYYKNEDLKSLLKDEPFFCEIDIEPYIYLSGTKPPEEVLVFDESLLNELLSDDSVKIEHTADTIKKMSDLEKEQYLDKIIPKLKIGTVGARVSAAVALGKIGDVKAVEPLIEALLKDANENVRWRAAVALGSIGNAEAVKPLIKALKDKFGYVRGRATRALGSIGDAKAVKPSIKALKDEEEYVRRGAAKALGEIGGAEAVEAVEPLIEALKDENADVRWRGAEALGKIGDVKAVGPVIEALLKDEHENVRWSAAGALGRIGKTRAVKPLIKTLKDNSSRVRGEAAVALGSIGNAEAVKPLIEALTDEDKNVRWSVAGALGKIGDIKAIESLKEALKDKNEGVRWRAAEALGSIGNAEAVEPLIEALKDRNVDVRWRGAEALGKIGDTRAIDQLKEAASKDKELIVRDKAKEALKKIEAK